MATLRLSSHDLSEIVSDYSKITELLSISKQPGYGVFHNGTRQSMFWELSYWKDNMIKHNLDVMRIATNVFDNISNTTIDISGMTKDNVKAIVDLKEICHQLELELIHLPNGKVMKPKANYTLSKKQKKIVCQ